MWFNLHIQRYFNSIVTGQLSILKNIDLMPDMQQQWQLGVFYVLSFPDTGWRRPKTSLTPMPTEGPQTERFYMLRK